MKIIKHGINFRTLLAKFDINFRTLLAKYDINFRTLLAKYDINFRTLLVKFDINFRAFLELWRTKISTNKVIAYIAVIAGLRCVGMGRKLKGDY